MTEDRRNLLLSVAEQMYSRRCKCGRCDCVTSDPFEIARRVLLHWSVQCRTITKNETGRAELYRKFQRDAAESEHAILRERAIDHEKSALAHERHARRYARAAARYERLGRGLPPFVATETL